MPSLPGLPSELSLVFIFKKPLGGLHHWTQYKQQTGAVTSQVELLKKQVGFYI